MIYRRLPVLLFIAFCGCLITSILFPRFNPAARWDFVIDRDSAIAKAYVLSSQLGIDTKGWTPLVVARQNRAVEYYLSKQPDSQLSQMLTPVTVSVKLVNYHTGSSIRFDLNTKGDVIGFRRQEHKSSKPPEPSATTAPAVDNNRSQTVSNETLSTDQRLVESVINQLFGARFKQFTSADASSSKEGRKFTWSVSDQQLKISAVATVRDSSVKSIVVETNLTPQFRSEYSGRRNQMMTILSNAENIVIWPAIILVLIFYFTGLALKQIMHRVAVVFLVITFLLLVSFNFLGAFADDFREDVTINTSSVSYWAELLFPWLFFVLVNLLVAALLYLSLAAGLALAIRVQHRRTIDLELLLSGKLNVKPVPTSIIAGLIFGGVMSAIPYLAAVSKLFRGIELDSSGFDDLFVSRSPSFSSFIAFDHFLIFVILAFLASLINAYIRRPLIAKLSTFAVLFLGLMGTGSVHVSAPALALVSALEALLLTAVYNRFGVLAAMTTCMAAQAVLSSAALLAQPSGSLQFSGWNILIGLGAMLVVSLAGLLRARDVTENEVAIPPGMLSTRSERERLRAEFDVARRAQQQMLPDAPPKIDGLEIAAVCQPSKEVGGDLYDFILLPEGKLGIVVADVSGKGVPASLFMTLTKGLLDSVSEEQTDPGEILREVNRHLYEVCRRKVFVTLFLGVIDPVGRTMSYARAGHNPTVFHRPSEQTILLLKPPGMGLGLNNGKIFDKSLKVETLRLEPNDSLFFYSDGITEAMNANNEEYGEQRLMNVAAGTNGMSAKEMLNAVLNDVSSFLGKVPQQDDQTLVVVRIDGKNGWAQKHPD